MLLNTGTCTYITYVQTNFSVKLKFKEKIIKYNVL